MFTRTKIGYPDLEKLLGLDSLAERDGGRPETKLAPKFPFTDISMNPEDGVLHVELAVAGFGKDDIEISIEDNLLLIKGTVSSTSIADDANMKYFQKDISKRDFIRKIKLQPEHAQSESIAVDLENGILLISIWPVKEVKTSRKIEIS